MDEEIESDIAEDDNDDAEVEGQQNKKTQLNDPFFVTEDQLETVEEKKLKMTKQLLQELQQPGEKQDFFESL